MILLILKKIQDCNVSDTCQQLANVAEKAGLRMLINRKYNDEYNGHECIEGSICEIYTDNPNRENSRNTFCCQFVIEDFDGINIDWLDIGDDHFQAISLEVFRTEQYDKFFFDFAISYFEDNYNDYLVYDSEEWAYSANEIMKLKDIPYNESWMYEKLV